MATTKVTFTLDTETVARLSDAAIRLSLPKSTVVREAILDFHERIGQLGEREKQRLLRVFDEVLARIPARDVREVEQELKAIRQARRAGGRRTRGRVSK